MKKQYFAALAMAGLLLTTSCNGKNSYALDITGINSEKEVVDQWLGNVSYSSEYVNTIDNTQDHYRIYLPTNIEESLRVNVLNVEELINDKFSRFNVVYGSTSLTSTSLTYVANIASLYVTVDTLDFDARVSATSSIACGLGDASESVEGKTRSLYTVYLPMYVEHYGVYSKNVKLDTKTYVIVPITYGVTYSTGSDLLASLEGVDEDIKSLQSITFKTNNGVLA